MTQITGNLFILAAPSGAGKSSLIRALLTKHHHGDLCPSVSHTTRAPRPGEVDGEHYHFVSKAEFEAMIERGDFFEWAKVFDNYYGTSKAAIDQTLEQGKDVLLDIDWQGARQVKAQRPDTATIFIAPPSAEALRERLKNRQQDSDEVIEQRMTKAKAEISHYDEFDYIVVNDDFDTALKDIEHIVFGQRLRGHQQRQRHRTLFEALLGG
ncbi:Guanylate kinase [Saliniradius amylolyticus]|uniref:Guanylate kinase n=1 Tax=Saliniradius amylolyticus TaxID=2183582 RepID=A0A2S2E6R1_9ALTE|nr:guanylate kinase [Saliniradius amylolyticus]AWL13344.1 Guanylate kinase [Saliniradius amylolyticus]